ncbi:hypothetical protein FGIG_07436 [Fasciola gigantica]|uniref:Uncharacterized protein n=1 Tax=Fasciola gigantica TaxID=46835 RepID=A0A504YMK6_FASGI|nr:hypothetical protein FGIG_07436 [Fasciola gigantica]
MDQPLHSLTCLHKSRQSSILSVKAHTGLHVLVNPLALDPATHGHNILRGSTTLKQYIVEVVGESGVKDLLLQCWYWLYVHSPEAQVDLPPSDRVPRRVSRQHQGVGDSLDNTPRLLYDSRWEPNKILMDQLTAMRTFTPDPKPAAASLAWIAAVVIGVIIVTSVIVLTVWLHTRDRRKVYMLDAKEYAHGKDPKLKMKEKENFQTYEPQGDQLVASSHCPLNGGDISAGSDEDGELDDYRTHSPTCPNYSSSNNYNTSNTRAFGPI